MVGTVRETAMWLSAAWLLCGGCARDELMHMDASATSGVNGASNGGASSGDSDSSGGSTGASASNTPTPKHSGSQSSAWPTLMAASPSVE